VKNRFIVVLVAIGAGLLLATPACSNQAEGERCDTRGDNFGNDECDDNMRCTPAVELTGSATDRCCPNNRAQSETAICKVPGNPIGGDAAPPSDAAAGDASASDGNVTVDTGSDAPVVPADAGDAG